MITAETVLQSANDALRCLRAEARALLEMGDEIENSRDFNPVRAACLQRQASQILERATDYRTLMDMYIHKG